MMDKQKIMGELRSIAASPKEWSDVMRVLHGLGVTMYKEELEHYVLNVICPKFPVRYAPKNMNISSYLFDIHNGLVVDERANLDELIKAKTKPNISMLKLELGRPVIEKIRLISGYFLQAETLDISSTYLTYSNRGYVWGQIYPRPSFLDMPMPKLKQLIVRPHDRLEQTLSSIKEGAPNLQHISLIAKGEDFTLKSIEAFKGIKSICLTGAREGRKIPENLQDLEEIELVNCEISVRVVRWLTMMSTTPNLKKVTLTNTTIPMAYMPDIIASKKVPTLIIRKKHEHQRGLR